ncbi:MAG: type IX secretion system sortase PorU [candidate division Zixibacteria bacterium]|nr:type IX secretion system sortase PorU [candidate division Zixibacteria bacterium]
MKSSLCKSLIFACFAVLVGVFPSRGANLQVISSSASQFHFTLTLNLDDLDYRTESDSLRSRFYTVQVGIPYGANPRLQLAEGNQLGVVKAIGGKSLKQSSVSHPVVELSKPLLVRGRQLVRLNIFPIVGAKMYHKVEVLLSFDEGMTAGGTVANDPYFDRIFQSVLANYKQFSRWPVYHKPATKQVVEKGPFSGDAEWYKIEINQTGIYGVTGSQLQSAGLNLNSLQSDNLHILNGGGLTLPLDNLELRPKLEEISILVADGGDGIFDLADTIFFFGEAVDRWLYRSGMEPNYVNNVYGDVNVYWLKIASETCNRMSEVDASPELPIDTIVTTFRRHLHSEQDNIIRRLSNGRIPDYYRWYWSDDPSMELFVTTPGAVENKSAHFVLNGYTYDPDYMDLWVNDVSATDTCNKFECRCGVSSLHDGLNEIYLELHGGSEAGPYFDCLNIEYTSLLVPDGNILDIMLEPFDGRARLDVIDNFTSQVMVLDLADPLHPAILTGVEHSEGTISFSVMAEGDGLNRFYVEDRSSALSPESVEHTSPADLYLTDKQTDLIVITDHTLVSTLDEYVEYRQNEERSISVVAVEDIYDNFSFGLFDPAAIRDFLKYAYEHYPSPSPSAVLFVGDGNYDYLNNLGTGLANRVPSWIMPSDGATSDDSYVYFGAYGLLDGDTSYTVGSRGYDMLTARWPVRSTDEINTIVAKIKQYESESTLGFWRNKITFIADDEHAGSNHEETFHADDCEELERYHTPRSFQRNKIYLWDYPFVGRYKPDVNGDIVKAFNDGSLIVNYIGHGSPDLWAHEHVFTRIEDLPKLTNYNQLPLVFVASCASGFFEDPFHDGMAEDLLSHPAGGAIAVVSATRLVYAADNAAFNQSVYDVLFEDDSLSIAEAVYLAKLRRQYANPESPTPVTNDRKYILFGDPCMKLGKPQLDIEFTSHPDSLTALGKAEVSGRILGHNGNTFVSDGQLLISVYDSDLQKTYSDIDYFVTGPTLYRGTAAITSGEFNFEFVTPLDVGYGGKGARILLYAKLGNTDAMGLVDSLCVADNVAPSTDSTGPKIEYSIVENHGFVSGDVVHSNDHLRLVLTDSSGVNLSGALGHGITLTIDKQSENMINLTSMFNHDQDDFTTGRLEYSLENLNSGHHSFKLKAWDNANNSASIEFTAEVKAYEKPAIVDLLNYPNPMKEETRFSCRLTQPMEKLLLEIFTLSGRRIKTFERYPIEIGYFDDIVWYGVDTDGDRVATGVYIYKATAAPTNGSKVVEAFGKIIVVN